jgi:hypothetical protein
LSWSERNDFELDHVVPRCLDGSNDLSNLQLQPWPEAEEKDHREAETCRAYCNGAISLEQVAQFLQAGVAIASALPLTAACGNS